MRDRRLVIPVSRSLLSDAELLLARVLRESPYVAGAVQVLRDAVASPSAEARARVSMRGEEIEGVIIFGTFGGANGAGRLHLIAVDEWARRARAGRVLVDDAIAELRADGARFVLAELPDDARALPAARAFLGALGFVEESRVEDFYRDGVALSFMRRELDR